MLIWAFKSVSIHYNQSSIRKILNENDEDWNDILFGPKKFSKQVSRKTFYYNISLKHSHTSLYNAWNINDIGMIHDLVKQIMKTTIRRKLFIVQEIGEICGSPGRKCIYVLQYMYVIGEITGKEGQICSKYDQKSENKMKDRPTNSPS